MVNFNFTNFLFDKRISAPELAKKLKVSYVGVWEMQKRGTIKLSFLRQLESIFGDCSDYIIKEEENQVA
ncbi:MAG: hypothetical protein CMF23_18005 [Ignavibacteriae bacterium]|nr:hypothetical protein [Ignavibacteriota bacterium]|tara:strand:+ start:259 stop:465 length:207 start_codon:yes stop_codon:yes gene_type:complete